jgi:probable F420-dependent oxidoreductase
VLIGFTFPVLEVSDPVAVRDIAQAGEDLGYSHLLAWEHVLGADPAGHPQWQGVPTLTPVHEPLVLFGFLAGLTRRIELVTGVLILPQRQTGLVAKQVAEVHLLSEGRIRLGIGVGWVQPEFAALGAGWHDRGARTDEQIDLLRTFLDTDVVDFHGRWHDVEAMGVCPRPRTPVPVWVGGNSAASMRRAVTHGDGWMPLYSLDEAIQGDVMGRLHAALSAVGRPPGEFGVELTVHLSGGLHQHAALPRSVEDVRGEVEQWARLGVTHLNINTQGLGLSAGGHVVELTRQWEALGDLAHAPGGPATG